MDGEDKILIEFFEPKRWQDALDKGSVKGLNTAVLRELMSPVGRQRMLADIISGNYHIERPRTAKIPKDTPGEFRTVFINNDRDRVFLSLLNDLLFDLCGDMVHPQCTSYQKGLGCSETVTKASKLIDKLSGTEHDVMGWKSDLSKYFDSVPIQYIDAAFNTVERKYGKSLVIDIVREYYHNDNYYDSEEKAEKVKYQSLKQGCAVAAWLADVMLYHVDKMLSKLDGYYVRYSDDTLFIGKDYVKAMEMMTEELGKMKMTLNPKKVEYLTNDKWFKFLGFSIKGRQLSLSGKRIKTFASEVASRTIKLIRRKNPVKYEQILKNVQSWLYYGNGEHSWASGVLKTINVKSDIDVLNGFVMDCLRAVMVGKPVNMNDIGGLGWERSKKDGCIVRGKGRRVRTLRNSTPKQLPGYYTIDCMRHDLIYSRDLYDSVVRDML